MPKLRWHYIPPHSRLCFRPRLLGEQGLDPERLLRWSERLQQYFPEPWIENLRFLSDAKIVEWRYGRNLIPFHGLISFDEKEATLARQFDFPRLDEKFEWMIDPYSE